MKMKNAFGKADEKFNENFDKAIEKMKETPTKKGWVIFRPMAIGLQFAMFALVVVLGIMVVFTDRADDGDGEGVWSGVHSLGIEDDNSNIIYETTYSNVIYETKVVERMMSITEVINTANGDNLRDGTFIFQNTDDGIIYCIDGFKLVFAGEIERTNFDVSLIRDVSLWKNGVLVDWTDYITAYDREIWSNGDTFLTEFHLHFNQNIITETGFYEMSGTFDGVPFGSAIWIEDYFNLEDTFANPDDLTHVSLHWETIENGNKKFTAVLFLFNGVQNWFDTDDLHELTFTRNGEAIDFTIEDITGFINRMNAHRNVFMSEGEFYTQFFIYLTDSYSDSAVYQLTGYYMEKYFESEN
jgi:hypothetical protein